MYSYRALRLSNITSPRYRHLLLLLFWPLYGLAFGAIERLIVFEEYYPMYFAPLDDLIPFNEFFLIPYLFWFVFLIGMLVYGLLWDIAAFKRYMFFIMITYTATCVIYLLFPNCQELRAPESFVRENFLTRFMEWYYNFDTNTNVCPSLHVIGSVAVLYAAWDSKHFSTPARRTVFAVTAALISVSTVFVKQHSVLDIPPALLLCALAAPLASMLAKRTFKVKEAALA